MLLLDRKDIEKQIDSYYLKGEESDIINFYIDDFLEWQVMASDDEIIFLHNVLEANEETIGSMIIELASSNCSGFCGIYGDSTSIQEAVQTLHDFHYFFKNQFSVARKVVTWDFSCMFGTKKEAMEELAEHNCNSLFEYACKELDIYYTRDGFVEKIYY